MGLKKHLYNADEMGLFWNILPNKTYIASNEKNCTRQRDS